jgi:predicted lipoprotein
MDRTAIRISSEQVSYRPLVALEKVIQEGQLAYVEVGKALQEIQKGKLYKKNYNTFEEYCEKRWGFERQTVYDYIKASDVEQNVRTCVQTTPTLCQARELAVLDPDQQKEIAKKVDFANTTVKELKAKIDKVRKIDPPSQKMVVEEKEKTLEQWLDDQITKIALQPYGHYAAKFEKYPWQHPTERADVENSKTDIYKAVAAICAKKLRRA